MPQVSYDSNWQAGYDGSPGSLLKRLDQLIAAAESCRARLATEKVLVDELKAIQKETRYRLMDIGPSAQRLLETVSTLSFEMPEDQALALEPDWQRHAANQLEMMLRTLRSARLGLEQGSRAVGTVAASSEAVLARVVEELERVYPRKTHLRELHSALSDLNCLTRDGLLEVLFIAFEEGLLECVPLPGPQGWEDAANILLTAAGRRFLSDSRQSAARASAGILSRPGVRHLAFLFTDVEGSTRLTDSRGNEWWARVRSELLRIAEDAIVTNGGEQVKNMGDGIFAVFEAGSCAAKCAVEIVLRSCEFSQSVLGDDTLRIRAGLHTGEATVEGGDATGTDVNLTSRVMGEARGGQILCTASVRDAINARGPGWLQGTMLRSRGSKVLRGFEPRETDIWEIVTGDGNSLSEAAEAHKLPPSVYLALDLQPAYLKSTCRFRLVNNSKMDLMPLEVHVWIPSSILDGQYNPAIDRAVLSVGGGHFDGVPYTQIVYRNNRPIQPSRFPGPEPLTAILAPRMESVLRHVLPEVRYPLTEEDLSHSIRYEIFAKGSEPFKGELFVPESFKGA